MIGNLLKSIFSFPGLCSILEIEERSKFFEKGSFSHLIHKMIFIGDALLGDSLINVEDTHQIGLKVLSVLSASLDSFIMLQAKFKFQDALLKLQSDSRIRLSNRALFFIFKVTLIPCIRFKPRGVYH
jgi:hypothetical protein